MKVRPMEQENLDKVAKIWSFAWAPKVELDQQVEKEKLSENLSQFPELCFVVEEENEILGFVVASKYSGDILNLGPMAVAKDATGRGLGRRLVERVEERARERGYTAVILNTRRLGQTSEKKKYEASGFYKELGFKEIARSKKKRVMFKRIVDE